MTADQLRNYFKVYLDQIPLLVSVNADWALLNYIVVLPDICGALENPNGLASSNSYINWANRYIADALLSGDEWYDIRCRVLHQGITAGRRRYPNYFFKSPGVTSIAHKSIRPDGSIILDVHKMKDELLTGLERWFCDVESSQQPQHIDVTRNVSSLAGVVTISGTNSTSVASIQLSGTVSRTII